MRCARRVGSPRGMGRPPGSRGVGWGAAGRLRVSPMCAVTPRVSQSDARAPRVLGAAVCRVLRSCKE